jgi:hypothetical protein
MSQFLLRTSQCMLGAKVERSGENLKVEQLW